jgi:hypothetical protein
VGGQRRTSIIAAFAGRQGGIEGDDKADIDRKLCSIAVDGDGVAVPAGPDIRSWTVTG